jgi:hypothetical protein
MNSRSYGLQRAFAEAVVIFVGIFAALAVDSWSDGRAAREREVEYIASLAEDFAENEARLTEAIQIGDSVIAAAKVLLSLPAAGEGPQIDSLTSLLTSLRRLATFEPITKTYDNILGAGDLLTLRDPELKAALADFQSRLLLMNVVQETQERQLVSILQPYFIENLDYVATLWMRNGEELPDVIASHASSAAVLLGTRKFRNWVGVRLDWADDVRAQHTKVLQGVRLVQVALRATSGFAPLEGAVGCWASNRPRLDTFRLTISPKTGESTFSPNFSGAVPTRTTWFRIRGTDSIRINWGYGGFDGETVRARLNQDLLKGVSQRFTDEADATFEPDEFEAVKIECPKRWKGSV